MIYPILKSKEKLVYKWIISAFGYGKKTDLDVGKHPHNVVPSSDTYNIKSFVETNKNKQKGFTPRYSREVIW